MPARPRSPAATKTTAPRKTGAKTNGATTRANGAAVVRITEASGESPRGWEAAVAAAVKSSDARRPIGVEVLRLWAEWDGRALSRYHATVKVAYRQTLKPAR